MSAYSLTQFTLSAAGSCYEDIIEALAQKALSSAQQLQQQEQHIVGIAGSPGSGKSTLARLVADRVNSLSQQQGLKRGAAVAPMDGFHLYKAQLDQMPDPQVRSPCGAVSATFYVRLREGTPAHGQAAGIFGDLL